MFFRDRSDAGRKLAARLEHLRGRPNLLVLGLPRGGVPVAFEVARSLDAPLDVYIIRKLGVPGQEELAMGAIAPGGVRVLNEDIIAALGITDCMLEKATRREEMELHRRMSAFRGDAPKPILLGKEVILVDDGLATGATMRAAIAAARQAAPARIITGVPVASRNAVDLISREADEVVSVYTPPDFHGVGEWYEDFWQTEESEVIRCLAESSINRRG